MPTLQQVEQQLERIGCAIRFWGKPEVRELPNILLPDEQIACAINGRYANGAALLVATNYRLLLIDKKPLFLAVEDIRFDMISEIDFSARLFNSTARVITPTRQLLFSSLSQARLRSLVTFAQQQVVDIRRLYMQQQFMTPNMVAGTRVTASHVGELALQPRAYRRTF